MIQISVMSWSSIDIYTTILTNIWLGFWGWGCPGRMRVGWVRQVRARHRGICIPGFVLRFGQWVFQCWCFSLRSNSVWMVLISGSGLAWALLVMGDYWGFDGGFLICSSSDVGPSFWDKQNIHTL